MRTVTFEVSSAADVKRRTRGAMRGEAQGSHVSFASAELLFSLMTLKRWEIIRAMAGAGAMSIREVARRVSRDVKAVHGDIHALLNAGVVRKDEVGLVVFPFDAVHIDVTVKAA